MSETAATQLRRLLHVIPRIADGLEHPVADVAALAGVDMKTLVADLESLVERYDAPGGFVDGVQIYIDGPNVAVTSDHLRRPMRLTMAELCALELGLAIVRAERAPDEQAPVNRALGRLRETITRLPANDAHEGLRHAELAAAGDVALLGTIRGALAARRKVRIRYRGGDAAEGTDRVIAPYGLVFSSGMWYVVAYCDRSTGVRVFRLDRVERGEATDEAFDPPADSVVDAVLRDGKPLSPERPASMTVRYSPRVARWVAEREGQELDTDGALTMDHPLADPAWGVRHVLQYGPEAEVVEPAWMRERVVERLRAMKAG
jgi:proteasome accessory factor C